MAANWDELMELCRSQKVPKEKNSSESVKYDMQNLNVQVANGKTFPIVLNKYTPVTGKALEKVTELPPQIKPPFIKIPDLDARTDLCK